MLLYGSIFLVVSAVIAAVRFFQSEDAIGQMKRIFGALHAAGIAAARFQIDSTATLRPGQRTAALASRFAALALVGDREALTREVDAITDPVTVSCLTKAYGLVGLVLVGDERAAARLAEHAATCERELPKIQRAIRAAVRDIAAIGAGVVAGPTDAIAKLRPGLIIAATPWTKALLQEACARAFERDGKRDWATNARGHNAHLERARQAS